MSTCGIDSEAGGPLPPPAPGTPPGGRRIPGIDLARALAILGMLAVHVGPTDEPGVAGTLYGLTHGRAAILFGLLAGVGVSLLVASRTSTSGQARLTLLWRTALLLPLGLWLQPLDHGVFVILQDYALLFLVAIAVFGLADRWLLALAGSVGALGSVGYLWGLIHRPEEFERRAAEWGDPLGELIHRLVLSGPYPLITWAAPFLLGMWIGRRDLRRTTTRWWLMGVGAFAALGAWALSRVLLLWWQEPVGMVTWDRLVVDDPHSQMPLWLIGSTGSAVLILGLALIVADRWPRFLWPMVATGQLAFTVYVGHLLLLGWQREALTSDEVGGAVVIVAGFAVAAMVLATAWRAVLARGPLELLLHLPSGPRARASSRDAEVARAHDRDEPTH